MSSSSFIADFSTAAIKNVSLAVDPPAVRRGQHATLRCLYELDDTPIYSVKFYRGPREFYRYSPSDVPPNKLFPFPGIHVDVSLIYFTRLTAFSRLFLFLPAAAQFPSPVKTFCLTNLVAVFPSFFYSLFFASIRFYFSPHDVHSPDCSGAVFTIRLYLVL